MSLHFTLTWPKIFLVINRFKKNEEGLQRNYKKTKFIDYHSLLLECHNGSECEFLTSGMSIFTLTYSKASRLVLALILMLELQCPSLQRQQCWYLVTHFKVQLWWDKNVYTGPQAFSVETMTSSRVQLAGSPRDWTSYLLLFAAMST